MIPLQLTGQPIWRNGAGDGLTNHFPFHIIPCCWLGQYARRGGGARRRAIIQEQDRYASLFKKKEVAHSQNPTQQPPAGHSYSFFSQKHSHVHNCSASSSLENTGIVRLITGALFISLMRAESDWTQRVKRDVWLYLSLPRLVIFKSKKHPHKVSACLLSQSVTHLNCQEVVHPCIVF